MKKKKKNFAMTLIEIMVVIVLIGIVTGALAFNMSGSMDRGRAFKTEQNIARIKDILLLEMADSDATPQEIVQKWVDIVTHSPLVLKQGQELMKDGWNKPIVVTCHHGKLKISSEKLAAYNTKYGKKDESEKKDPPKKSDPH